MLLQDKNKKEEQKMPFRISLTPEDIRDVLIALGYTSNRADNLDLLDASVASRAPSGEVDATLTTRGLSETGLAKLDNISAQVRAEGNVAAVDNNAGLTVSLDTDFRTVIEVKYSCGAAADFVLEASDDGINWFTADTFSEPAAVPVGSERVRGYNSARRHVRLRSLTTGIDLAFELVAVL
ncbi:hypothetical protein M1N82_01645 [Dehalococcoidia bacterium]|nr:hypothetical protein [Dehalococcoidia bacterium]